eukprot:2248542-Rhodomonas_salina.2
MMRRMMMLQATCDAEPSKSEHDRECWALTVRRCQKARQQGFQARSRADLPPESSATGYHFGAHASSAPDVRVRLCDIMSQKDICLEVPWSNIT